jgi:LmbE family N-acetylglucosaminyl deacetylase
MQNDFPHPERVLVISAHPDDPDFGSAGTVARWTGEGVKVTYVVVTDGSKGSHDSDIAVDALVKLRQAEQLAAAKILGVNQVVFLGYPDGQIFNTRELRGDIVRQIRMHKPDIIITHDPTTYIVNNAYINHPDHRAVGSTVLDAIFPLARDMRNYPEQGKEGLEAHIVRDIFLTYTSEPNLWVDITEKMDDKIAALRRHHSQISDFDALEKRLREVARDRAKDQHFEFAETFRRITMQR